MNVSCSLSLMVGMISQHQSVLRDFVKEAQDLPDLPGQFTNIYLLYM
jgi:hypothetical protein